MEQVPPGTPQPSQPERTTRVLVVEDNPADADLVRLALEEAGEDRFEVDHVARLSEALARVRGPSAPDVALLDLTLPDASGLEGVRAVVQAAPDVPVVVHTGTVDRSLGAAAINAGAQDYLQKGADAALVSRALRYAIDRHELATRARMLEVAESARAAADAARERMSILAEASTAVSHSLEDRHALVTLASTLVPRFADWCAIGALGAAGEAPEWNVAHVDGACASEVEATLLSEWAAPTLYGPRAVVATGRPELYADVAANAPASRWRDVLERLGARAAMIVPLSLRGDVLGVVVLGSQRPRYGPDELAVAEEIGRRAGIALSNCRLYREARLAIAARDEFLAVAAHELRTPVAVLKLKAQQLELKQQASACATCAHAVPADFAGAARQIERLGQLVEGLLDVSRVAGGRVKIERADVDLREVVQATVRHVADLVTLGRSTISVRCPEPIPGRWDRLAIERVVANLVSNALKFGLEKPIEVRLGLAGDDAVLEIVDHGIGIAPEDLDRIFDQFERVVSSRHYAGLGLGLFIARRLVEEHGGTIAVASQPGSGTVFTVRLPRA